MPTSALSMTLISRVSDGLPLAASMEDEKDHRELDGLKTQAKRIVKQLTANSPSKVSIDSGSSFFHYINAGGVCYLCLTDKAYPKRLAFNYLEELQKEYAQKSQHFGAGKSTHTHARCRAYLATASDMARQIMVLAITNVAHAHTRAALAAAARRQRRRQQREREQQQQQHEQQRVRAHSLTRCARAARRFVAKYSGEVEGATRPYAFIKFDTFIQKTKKLYVDTRTQRNLNKLNEELHDIQQIMTRNIQVRSGSSTPAALAPVPTVLPATANANARSP